MKPILGLAWCDVGVVVLSIVVFTQPLAAQTRLPAAPSPETDAQGTVAQSTSAASSAPPLAADAAEGVGDEGSSNPEPRRQAFQAPSRSRESAWHRGGGF
jgi:hypothetical protein